MDSVAPSESIAKQSQAWQDLSNKNIDLVWYFCREFDYGLQSMLLSGNLHAMYVLLMLWYRAGIGKMLH